MTNQWQDVPKHFKGFLSALRIPWDLRECATEAVASAAESLDPYYHPSSCLNKETPTAHFRLVGGLAKDTAISPIKTVDMLYILPKDLKPDTGSDAETRHYIAKELSYHTGKAPGKDHLDEQGWLIVPTGGGHQDHELTLRIMPCFPLDGGGYELATAPSDSDWRFTHPDAELAGLRQAQQIGGNKVHHLIRMLKCWQRTHNVAIPSIALELLTLDFLNVWTYQRRSLLFYDWMVRDFFFWLKHQACRDLVLPGGLQSLYIGDIWVEDAELAHAHADAACRQERASKPKEAMENWQALFGGTFS